MQEANALPSDPAQFLCSFAKAGFFIDDFSQRRGDKPASRAGDADVRESVLRIGETISADAPLIVVGVLHGLSELVQESVHASTRPDTPWRCLHFPHSRNPQGQRRYQEGLREVLRDVSLRDAGGSAY
jgi:hypothetical protein